MLPKNVLFQSAAIKVSLKTFIDILTLHSMVEPKRDFKANKSFFYRQVKLSNKHYNRPRLFE